MRKNKIFVILIFCFSILFTGACSTINSLTNVEVITERFSPQFSMQFSKPIYFERKVYKSVQQSTNKITYRLELSFPATNLKDFQEKHVVSKLKKLRSFVKDVQINHCTTPCSRVVLSINLLDDILVRWSSQEYPNFLILDFFVKSELNRLRESGKNLEYAKFDIDSCRKGFTHQIPARQKKKLCVLVDAGHGGCDPGAKGFFLLKEKDLALDIARRTKSLLSILGYNAFLTRNKDETLSLVERSRLASQLKADLFISIHVNAAASNYRASGVESYYLDSKSLLPPCRRGGFFGLNGKKEVNLAKFADTIFARNVALSKYLASSIQGSILSFLNKNKTPVIDRGIKRQRFQVLLRSEIPVALIEVGFLTNKLEAKRLSVPNYRQLLAKGICGGIKRYFDGRSKKVRGGV